MHGAHNIFRNACTLSAKNAHALLRARLCNGTEASLPSKLLRTYFESCASIVQAVVCHPPCLLSRWNQSPDAVRSRNPPKSTLAHDTVAAAVLHKHHSIIHVGAGLIQFVYGSHSRLAAGLTSSKIPFSPSFCASWIKCWRSVSSFLQLFSSPSLLSNGCDQCLLMAFPLLLPCHCLKGTPICSNVSHNHVDKSIISALKAISSLTLSNVTTVSPPCLSSNLPAYLGSASVKIMQLSGCCGLKFIFRHPPLHSVNLPPRPSWWWWLLLLLSKVV